MLSLPEVSVAVGLSAPVLGLKRDADLSVASLGKRARSMRPSLEVVPFEPAVEPELFLQVEDGMIKVSPAKKRGRPYGSKNKPKAGVVSAGKLGVKAGGLKRAKKRSFGGRRKRLFVGESSGGSSETVVVSPPAVVEVLPPALADQAGGADIVVGGVVDVVVVESSIEDGSSV